MTPAQTPIDTMAQDAAGASQRAQETAQEAKPAFERIAERLSDSISDMAHHSRDTAIETRKLLAQKAQEATTTAEHCIQKAPFKSMVIAVGVGAVAATVVSWLISPRSR